MQRILLLLLLWLPFSLPAVAQTIVTRIDVVAPADNPALADLGGGVQHALQRKFSLPVTLRTSAESAAGNNQNTLLIVIGDSLLPMASEQKPRYAATLALQVTSTSYFAALRGDDRVTALFRDQPLLRQLRLAKLILPNLRRVGIIHGHEGLPQTPAQLERLSKLSIQAIDIEGRADWPKQLSQLMLENDVLLGVEDPAIYNRDTIRSILLTTYRRGKFLIGPSRGFVGPGSLASCYTAPDQYIQQLLDVVAELLRTQQLPSPQYPRAFRVAVNPQVAASLGLSVPDEKSLTSRLQPQSGSQLQFQSGPQLQFQSGECGDDC